MSKKIRRQDALDYHSKGRPGKIEVVPTKETKTQRDLALAYSPGVAEPCRDIAAKPELVYKYTAKGNLVGVISNGTAVLGLGNIGPAASKPVMEGKGLLFKIFADIDVFDIEVDATDPDHFVQVVKALEPTFGGINLEDISAPSCFEIERRLREEMTIPVMHDDQHGTAIISGAALLNALDVVKKKIGRVRFVVSGAGASALSCCRLFCALGAKEENFLMFDSKGLLHSGRDDIDEFKRPFTTKKKERPTMAEALKGADVFIGLSAGNVVSGDMLKGMAKKPIVFALANPDPEITWEKAHAARQDLIMATGRSDYPNQVNNVLGFPFIFRGALDVQAKEINEDMKLAAVKALAELAKEPVPDIVLMAYNEPNFTFGKDYIIPKPVDPRLITRVSMAVARAAVESGVARKEIKDWTKYERELAARLGRDDQVIRAVVQRARQNPKRVVFAEADNLKVLKAAQIVRDEGIAELILLGSHERITHLIEENGLDLEGAEIIDPRSDENEALRNDYGDRLFEKRGRRGFNLYEARKIMRERNYFGAMMVEVGEADAFISGLTRNYPDTIKPCLQTIGTMPEVPKVAGMYIMLTKKGPLFFSDTTVNAQPSAKELYQIAVLTANAVRQFNVTPRLAFLSYSNFGSSEGEESIRIREAVAMLKENHPNVVADGEIQANLAFDAELLKANYPFSELIEQGANTLIFPNLSAGNIAYKLMQSMGAADAVGPVLLGMKKPVHILQLGSSVRDIVNMVAIAVVDAQVKTRLAGVQRQTDEPQMSRTRRVIRRVVKRK